MNDIQTSVLMFYIAMGASLLILMVVIEKWFTKTAMGRRVEHKLADLFEVKADDK